MIWTIHRLNPTGDSFSSLPTLSINHYFFVENASLMENMFGSKEDLRARCTYRSDLLAIILGNARFVYSFEDLRVIYEISNNSVKSVTDRQTNKLTKVGVEGQTVSPPGHPVDNPYNSY